MTHVRERRKQVELKFKNLYWLLGSKSELSFDCKTCLEFWRLFMRLCGGPDYNTKFQNKTFEKYCIVYYVVKCNEWWHRSRFKRSRCRQDSNPKQTQKYTPPPHVQYHHSEQAATLLKNNMNTLGFWKE